MPFSREFYKKPKNWIWLILMLNFFYKSLVNYLRLPDSINYFNDLGGLVLFHSIIFTYRRKNGIGAATVQLKIILLLLVETLMGYLINMHNPLTYIWGVRILFRFMLFFVACTLYVDETMLEEFFTLIYYLMICSVILTTFQKATGYSLDSVTGFFSLGKRTTGGSAGLNIFMCIVCTYYFVSAINKKVPFYKCVVSMVSCVYMAAIGELKMFYLELIIIIICSSLFTKISIQKIIGSSAGIGVVILGMRIYDFYYGEKNSLDILSLADYAGANGKTYGAQFSLNRTTAIPYVWNNILDDLSKKLFGLGAGYADKVSSDIFSSGFLKTYGTLGFHMFGLSLELANIGIIGLSIYLAFFISVFVYTSRMQKKSAELNDYYITCKVIVVIVFVTLMYNASLITDITASFIYFIMAIPFALSNQKKVTS